MPVDVGRITHLADKPHRSEGSNGVSITSNWRLSADGTSGVVWSPESANALSYASNSNDVATTGAAGASSLVSRADHIHRGVRVVSSNTSNSLSGDVNIQAGTGIVIGVAGQTVTVTNTGVPGPAGSVSYASNSNDVSNPSAAGASSLVSRADHVHRGIRSISHTSNTFYGDVIFTATPAVGITSPVAGTLNFTAAGSGGGGGSGPTDYVSGPSGSGHIVIPGLYGSADIKPGSPSASDLEFDTSTIGGTALGTPTSIDANTTAKSHLYIAQTAASGFNLGGRYWASPSMPFTVTAKITDFTPPGAQWNRYALLICEASPGKTEGIYIDWLQVSTISSTTYNSGASYIVTNFYGRGFEQPPAYLRIVVASSTDVTYYHSAGGLTFRVIGTANRNPGFTVGSVAVACSSESATYGVAMFVDWVRFT